MHLSEKSPALEGREANFAYTKRGQHMPGTNDRPQSGPMYRLRHFALLSVIAVPFALTACTEDAKTSGTSTTTTTTSASNPSADESTETSSTTTTSSSSDERVNANTASESEIAAALQAVGVPNAQRWAREVAEYRPYSDDNWQHLREELSKYNIDETTFTLIISALTI